MNYELRKNCQEGIDSVNNFLDLTQKIFKNVDFKRLVFRGQSVASWRVESSASRRIKKSFSINEVNKDFFIDYHRILLNNARLKGFHRKPQGDLHDLELIAELQHNSAATCLIDCSYNPLIALWFACSDHFDKDGAIFIINVQNSDHFNKIDYDIVQKKEISDLLFLDESKYWYWDPTPVNMRIPYQNSVFIFGLPIIKNEACIKINVKKDCKNKILKELEFFHNIKLDTLFNDLQGFSIANNSNMPLFESIPISLFECGVNAFQSGNYKESIQFFERSIKNGYCDEQIYRYLGIARWRESDYEKALKDLNRFLKVAPLAEDALYARMGCYKALGRSREMIRQLNTLIKLNPSESFYYIHQRAEIYNEQKRYLYAIRDYSKYLTHNPDAMLTYIRRAFCYKELGNLKKACEDIENARNLAHDSLYDTFMIHTAGFYDSINFPIDKQKIP